MICFTGVFLMPTYLWHTSMNMDHEDFLRYKVCCKTNTYFVEIRHELWLCRHTYGSLGLFLSFLVIPFKNQFDQRKPIWCLDYFLPKIQVLFPYYYWSEKQKKWESLTCMQVFVLCRLYVTQLFWEKYAWIAIFHKICSWKWSSYPSEFRKSAIDILIHDKEQ